MFSFSRRFFALLVLGICLGTGLGPLVGQKADDKHDPGNAVANLEVHPELEATLFASEPRIANPINCDIDQRGRVWVCDVQNYRGHSGKRPEGDRILILEDTDGDGRADKITTFYQGNDIQVPLGICVLGDKVIVTVAPNIFVFTKDENDKVLKKEVLFSKTGPAQNDHSAHTFTIGPDGRLYWNCGNACQSVHDKDGKPVIDLAGNVVHADGHPYRDGMVFRCEMDGSNFEVLGHNFRNNFEVTVDSFGTLWQSDNDDDGNRGVRINYVMEYGNYGYVDEMTGAGWQTKRTNMEKEIPLQHWHQNDPGVVPNLLGTGGGSPTGICVYEGKLLPRTFQAAALGGGLGGPAAMLIHCDAGPNVVRAYPVRVDGAGFKADIVDILDGHKKNNWFRPVDVCVAPDGSIFVTDWYDPVVGGNGQGDLDRGRIFRVAPKVADSLRESKVTRGASGLHSKYIVPKFDFTTTPGLIEVMKNPNQAARYLAWTKLREMGTKAESALQYLYQSKIPHERARALWLLGRIEGKGQHYVNQALADWDDNIRIVGIRLARQLKLDVIPIVQKLVRDRSPAVRRECAIALRHSKDARAAGLWAQLARQYDGRDRWYLEALGIGADRNWDAYLGAFRFDGPSMTFFGNPGRDVLWRSRATRTPELLAMVIGYAETPSEELPRLFRAFDFQSAGEIKDTALVKLALGNHGPARGEFIVLESLSRLPSSELKTNPRLAEKVAWLLEKIKGTPTFIEFVHKVSIKDRYPELLAMAQKNVAQQLGVDAMRALLDRDQSLVKTAVESKDQDQALKTIQALANAGHDRSNALLFPLLQNTNADLEIRRQATRALAKNRNGAQRIIKLAQEGKLGEELKPAAASALSLTSNNEIREQALKLFPIPTNKDNVPVPAISNLVRMKGNAERGREVFAKTGTCATCHKVNGEGKEVGPDLSEIGKKLGREALFENILYPSASIALSYETFILETKSGTVAQGVMVSQTPTEITLKGADALVRTFPKTEVETFAKTAVSLMPADLYKLITTQELADVVEYLQELKEAKKK